MSFLDSLRSVFVNKENNKYINKYNPEVFYETMIRIAGIISDNNKELMCTADLILKDPDKYITYKYGNNPPINFEIAFKNDVQDKQWWLIHDALTMQDYIHYLDWKDDAEMFVPKFDTLKGREEISAVFKEDDFDEEDNLTAIFTYVNGILDQYDYVLCVYDIDADGYPMFLTKKNNLQKLTESAEKIGHRIGRAEIF